MQIDFEAIASGIVDKMEEMMRRDDDPALETTREQKIAVVLKHLRPIRAKVEAT